MKTYNKIIKHPVEVFFFIQIKKKSMLNKTCVAREKATFMFFPSLQANFPNSLHVWLVSIKSVQGRVHHFCEIYCHSLNWLFLFLVVFFWGVIFNEWQAETGIFLPY